MQNETLKIYQERTRKWAQGKKVYWPGQVTQSTKFLKWYKEYLENLNRKHRNGYGNFHHPAWEGLTNLKNND